MRRRASASLSVVGQIVLMFCTLAVIWGVIAVYLRQEYQRAQRDTEIQTASLARAFEETVSGSVAVLDQTLDHVRDLYVRDPQHFTLENWWRDKTVLRGISVQIAVADGAGITRATTTPNGALNVSIADREHFKVQVAATEDRLFISGPVIGRVSNKLSIQFTRRMIGPDGEFAGVVVASLDPHALGVFRDSDRVEQGFAMLIGRDGVIRAARPETALIGTGVMPPPNPEMARMFGDGPPPDGTSTASGADAIVSYRAVVGYPLFVAVGIPRQTAFASYEQTRRDTMLAGLSLSLIVLLTGLLTIRQWYKLRRFRMALTITLENISQGIMMIDANRRMPVVNRRLAELLDVPLKIARPGGDFDAMLRWQRAHDEYRADLVGDPRVLAMIDAGGIDPELTFYERRRANGTVLEVRTTVLPDGGAVRTFTDVTERKRIEIEMARARDAAEAGIRARTEFLAVMSHEIRTPMNGILGAAGLLRDMRLDEEQMEYVRIIRESSEHLSSLIQNVLDFSRLDAGQLELEEIAFDPRVLIQSTIAMLRGEAQAKGLTLAARHAEDVPAKVLGDPSRLRQILVNLIGNGIKFTRSGGVTVESRLAASDAETVTLGVAVTDTGIGIDPADMLKLFSAFTQVDASISRRFGGTGLGLAICGQLTTLMGGTIGVDSTPGQGSVFRFTIRARRVAEADRTAPADTVTNGSARCLKVLLAEDNPTNRHVATRMLARMGHSIHAVEDGDAAVRAAAADDYDVILMDMMMPEVDGLTATRMIRAGEPPRRDTRIVGLTANAQPSDRAACEAAGMNDFLSKPVTMERLRAALELAAAPTPVTAAPAEKPGAVMLDTEFLRQLADDIGLDGVVEMLRVFLEDAPPHMTAIHRAMLENHIQTIRREAHALAGAARTVGLKRLGQAAAALQHASEQAGPDSELIETVAATLRDSLPLAAAWADAHEALAISDF